MWLEYSCLGNVESASRDVLMGRNGAYCHLMLLSQTDYPTFGGQIGNTTRNSARLFMAAMTSYSGGSLERVQYVMTLAW